MDDPRAVLQGFIRWATANGKAEALREACDLDREMAKRQKAGEKFWRAVRTLGSYRAACTFFDVKDEEEFLRRDARHQEVFWCPITQTWEG